MFSKSEVHCEFCMTPKEIWEPLKTYNSDRSCEIYNEFFNIIWDLEETKRYFYKDVAKELYKVKSNYPDIPNFDATINELIEIGLDTGIMTNKYINYLR